MTKPKKLSLFEYAELKTLYYKYPSVKETVANGTFDKATVVQYVNGDNETLNGEKLPAIRTAWELIQQEMMTDKDRNAYSLYMSKQLEAIGKIKQNILEALSVADFSAVAPDKLVQVAELMFKREALVLDAMKRGAGVNAGVNINIGVNEQAVNAFLRRVAEDMNGTFEEAKQVYDSLDLELELLEGGE